MKKKLLCPLITLLLLYAGNHCNAQVFSTWGLNPNGSAYDTINFVGDTLRFQFTGCPSGAYGQAKLVIYYEGDVNGNGEYLTVNFAGSSSLSNGPYDSLYTAGPNNSANNCAPEDSATRSFSVDTINAYAPDLGIIVIPSANVGIFCTRNRVRVRLEYTYCTFGVPVEFASILLTDSVLCPLNGPMALNGTPAGGVYSGVGTSGTNFDPYGLAAGNYTITYTAADSIGCISSTTATITVSQSPVVNDTASCPGIPLLLSGSNNSLIWYSDAALTNPLDTGISFTTPPLYHSTSYYVASSCNNYYFRVDTLLADSINIKDNNALVGDDRGGIAITPQYIYYIADGGGVRYDADMQNPLGGLATRDGLFSDLADGALYSLWNTTSNTEPQNNSTNYTVNAVRTLNANLSFGTGITLFSTPINLGNTNYFRNGIFAGAGILGLYSGNTNHFYVVNLCNGIVTDLGLNTDPKFRGTESWADWGIIEYDGINYSIVYRSNTGNDISRLQLPAGTTTSVGTFPAGISDMACVTYSPWNKNWYFHYEGVSAALGGTLESTGYANASDSMSVIPGSIQSCAEEVKVTISNANLGSDTTLCQQNYVIFAGLGYSNYTWNGINSNFNSYTATGTDTVVFQGLYTDGCNHLDTVIVTMNPLPVVDLGGDITNCGGPVVLDAGNTGATFAWSDASTLQTITASSSGTYTVTVTDGNGCGNSDNINVTINTLPNATFALSPALVCINWPPFALTGGLPAGGSYSGTAVSNGTFIPSFAGVGSFTITYSYTDANGCTDTASQSIVVSACTGIAEAFGNGTITVNPNPGNGLFSLDITDVRLKDISIEVSDLNGKIVYQSAGSVIAGINKKLDLSNLSEGIYAMKVYSEKQVKVIKLVIQK